MDPYREEPSGWGNVHFDLISEIKNTLNRELRPKYYARAEERVYVSDQDDPGRRAILSDVRLLQREPGGPSPAPRGPSIAVAEPVVLTTLIEEEIREAQVQVIDRSTRNIVSVIEVLSPTNKVPGARGRADYLRKRTEILHSESHWVEIDLLRQGVPIVAREALPPGDYFVHVSRVDKRPKGFVWPIQLRQNLPVIPIPLRPEDPDTQIDLQRILDTVYDASSYDLDVEPIRKLHPGFGRLRARHAASGLLDVLLH